MKLGETESSFNAKKTEFEKLRSDVQIKLKFLDENRVGSPPILFAFMFSLARINISKISKLSPDV